MKMNTEEKMKKIDADIKFFQRKRMDATSRIEWEKASDAITFNVRKYNRLEKELSA